MQSKQAANLAIATLIFTTISLHCASIETITPRTINATTSNHTIIHHSAVPDIVETMIPPQINKIIDIFNQRKKKIEVPEARENRFILWGPHGTGKNKIVSYVAQQTKSKILPLSASSLINTFQNSGADNIQKAFKVIHEQLRNSDDDEQGIILFINEADKMGSLYATDNLKSTMENTAAELWQLLDKYEKSRRILIALATNFLDRIPTTGLRDRFDPDNIIEVPLPNEHQSKELFNRFFEQRYIPKLLDDEFMLLTEQLTDNLGTIKINDLELYLENIMKITHQLAELLYNKKNLNQYSPKNQFHELLAFLREKNKMLLDFAKTTFPTNAKVIKIIKRYSYIIDIYANRVDQYLKAPHQQLSEGHLALLVQATKGFSIRDIETVMLSISKKMRENNDILSDAIIHESLKKIKDNKKEVARAIAKQERPQELKKIKDELDVQDILRRTQGETPSSTSSVSLSMGGSSSSGCGVGLSETHNSNGTKPYPTLQEIREKAPDGSLAKEASELLANRPSSDQATIEQQAQARLQEQRELLVKKFRDAYNYNNGVLLFGGALALSSPAGPFVALLFAPQTYKLYKLNSSVGNLLKLADAGSWESFDKEFLALQKKYSNETLW